MADFFCFVCSICLLCLWFRLLTPLAVTLVRSAELPVSLSVTHLHASRTESLTQTDTHTNTLVIVIGTHTYTHTHTFSTSLSCPSSFPLPLGHTEGRHARGLKGVVLLIPGHPRARLVDTGSLALPKPRGQQLDMQMAVGPSYTDSWGTVGCRHVLLLDLEQGLLIYMLSLALPCVL